MRFSIIFMIFAAGLLLFGCVNPPVSPGGNGTAKSTLSNGTNIQPPKNTTTTKPAANQSSGASSLLPSGYTSSLGDNVTVDYTLRIDGKVYDTSNATLANESGIFNPRRQYAPLTFTEEFNKGMIDGFIIGTLGMSINETLSFNVDAKRGYGEHDPKKVFSIPRYYNKSMREVVPRAYLESYNINISNGTGYSTNFGTVFIEDFNDDNVTLFYLLTPGDEMTVNGLPEKVDSIVGNLTAKIEYMLDVNKTYVLPNPSTGSATMYKVLDKTNETITLDSNHPLANKTLEFTVTMLDIVIGTQ